MQVRQRLPFNSSEAEAAEAAVTLSASLFHKETSNCELCGFKMQCTNFEIFYKSRSNFNIPPLLLNLFAFK